MKCPAEVYSASSRPYRGIPEPHYPFHDRTVVVNSCELLCLNNKKVNLTFIQPAVPTEKSLKESYLPLIILPVPLERSQAYSAANRDSCY